MRQLLINPDTNERVQASIAGAEDLRDRGWVDASPRNAPSRKDPGPLGIIVQNLRTADYNAASVERIHKFLQSGDREYVEGVLAYEQANQARPVVLALVNARLDELPEPDDDGNGGDEDDQPVDYSKLKQQQLKELLDKRDIEYPGGPVKNEKLVELLVEDDKKRADANG